MAQESAKLTACAEDGAVVTLVVPAALDPAIEQYWPAIGLDRCEMVDPAVPAKRIELTMTTGDGEPGVVVDGDFIEGGWLRFESELSLFAADHLHGRVAVHAGLVVANEHALLLPGSTHAGKSTLCLAFSEAGAVVLSDEYAIVDPVTGHATGWDRPMRRRLPGGDIERVPLPPSPGHPVAIDRVANLRYAPGADSFSWAPMTTSETVTALLANIVSAQRNPDVALNAALAIARGSTGIRGTRGDTAEAIDRLTEFLNGSG